MIALATVGWISPTLAFLLILIGAAGLTIEFFTPGVFIPGITGAVALAFGIYGATELPVRTLGIVLIVLALVLFVAELKFGGHGIFAFGAVAALVTSGIFFVNTGAGVHRVSIPVIIVVAVVLAVLTLLIVRKVVRAREAVPVSGRQRYIGAIAPVREAIDPEGQVLLDGALWQARSQDPHAHIPKGAKVRIEDMDGLTLIVSKSGDDDELDTNPKEPEQ